MCHSLCAEGLNPLNYGKKCKEKGGMENHPPFSVDFKLDD